MHVENSVTVYSTVVAVDRLESVELRTHFPRPPLHATPWFLEKGAAPIKAERWSKPELKLFPYQVGSITSPMDFDAGPSDFLRLSPPSVDVHDRLLRLPGYLHQLKQRPTTFTFSKRSCRSPARLRATQPAPHLLLFAPNDAPTYRALRRGQHTW